MRSFTPELMALLVEKKLCGTITPEEQALLEQWLEQQSEEQMIWHSEDPNEVELQKRLFKRIKEDAGIPDHSLSTKHLSPFRPYRWYAVAAILLLITGTLSYFLAFKKEVATDDMSTNQVETPDIAPGHYGAILTLANGHKMILDSTGTGKIAMQGNSRLIKKKGELTYEKATAETFSKDRTKAVNETIYNTMTTPRGREFKIVLSDGTAVWLNAASSITYPAVFTGKERKVIVTGEAYFEVAPDTRHPFIVSVGKTEIAVLGTHFNVMAYTDEKQIKTTLLEGAVKVSRSGRQVMLRPGQQARFPRQSDHIVVTTVDTRPAVAWVKGKLSLDNLGIAAIMRKISRWYDVDIKFEGPVPKGHFWGLINRKVNLSNILSVMQANGIEAHLKEGRVVVSAGH